MEQSLLKNQQKTITIERTEETNKNQNAFLQQHEQETERVLSPEEQREALYQSVTENRKWCGDSDDMKEIKWQIENLRLMQRLGDQVAPVDLLREYNWMIDLCRLYLQNREKEGAYYSDRHKLVRNLLDRSRQDRDALMAQDKNLYQNAFAAEHQRAVSEALKKPKAQASMSELTRRLKKAVPPSDKEFQAEKKEILALYDAVIRQYQKETDSFCILTSSKKKRAEATRIHLQLSLERKRIREMKFSTVESAKRFQLWGEQLQGKEEPKTVDQGFLDRNPQAKLVPVLQEDGYGIISEMLGVEGLFTRETKKVKYTDGTGEKEWYLRPEKEGLTIDQAVQEAKKQKLPLMYSENAMQKLQTAQLIDFIMGQTEHKEENFRVQIDVRNVDHVDYLVITDVTIMDHAQCLGTETPEELNQEKQDKTTHKIYDEEDKLQINGYDYKVADKIIALDGDQLAAYFKTLGLDQPGIDAMKKRLDKMKTLLQKDKESGRRNLIEKMMVDPLMAGNKEGIKTTIRMDYERSSPISYIRNSLIQDSGTKAGEMEKVNRDVEYELNSTREEGKRKKRIQDRLKSAEGGYANSPLQEKSRDVLEAIKKYLLLDSPAQVLFGTLKEYAEIDKLLNDFEQDRVESIRGRAIERLNRNKQDPSDEKLLKQEIQNILTEEEGGPLQYMQRLRPKALKTARDKIQKRIDELEEMQNKGSYEEEELSKLRDYLKDLVVKENVSGDLQFRPKDAWRMGDNKLESSLRMVSAESIELFHEDPKITDVVQGGTGDCYFLSALASVVEADPQFIRDHMKDNGNGTVTVKLYQPNSVFSGYSPILITVDKTVAYMGKEERGARSALWVQLYEKAFVLSGLRIGTRLFTKYKYSDIQGGDEMQALSWITGTKGEELFDYAKGKRKKDQRNPTMSKDWKVYDPKTKRTSYTDKFNRTAESVKESLKELLDQGAIVTAGTYELFAGPTGLGADALKRKQGLVGRHAYTVIGMEEIDGKTYVRIRDPWALGAVDTVKNELTGQIAMKEADRSKRQGSCLLEIHTFVEHMSNVSYVLKKNVKGMKKNGNQPNGSNG